MVPLMTVPQGMVGVSLSTKGPKRKALRAAGASRNKVRKASAEDTGNVGVAVQRIRSRINVTANKMCGATIVAAQPYKAAGKPNTLGSVRLLDRVILSAEKSARKERGVRGIG